MDPERLIGELVGGFLGGKKKRKQGGLGRGLDLLGVGGSSYGGGYKKKGGSLINAGTLLTVGGLIWGALETMQNQGGTPGTSPQPASGPGAVPPGPPRGVMSAPSATPGGAGMVVPPPLPPIPGATPVSSVPPVPAGDTPVPATLLPLVQLAVSAARADGEMSDEEVAAIREKAQALGAQALVDGELAARRPLESITAAFVSEEQRQVAYALAYAIVHGEDAVSPGERMYLTQLARQLRLDHAAVEQIERETLAGG